jgi:hypothetical protein
LDTVSGRSPRDGASRHRQDLLAGLLILRKAEHDVRRDASGMSNRPADTVNAMLCPACARPMTHMRTIWRAFHDDLQVFECRACDVSVSVKLPPQPD